MNPSSNTEKNRLQGTLGVTALEKTSAVSPGKSTNVGLYEEEHGLADKHYFGNIFTEEDVLAFVKFIQNGGTIDEAKFSGTKYKNYKNGLRKYIEDYARLETEHENNVYDGIREEELKKDLDRLILQGYEDELIRIHRDSSIPKEEKDKTLQKLEETRDKIKSDMEPRTTAEQIAETNGLIAELKKIDAEQAPTTEEPLELDSSMAIEEAVLDSKIVESTKEETSSNILSLHNVPGENTLNLDALVLNKVPTKKSDLLGGTAVGTGSVPTEPIDLNIEKIKFEGSDKVVDLLEDKPSTGSESVVKEPREETPTENRVMTADDLGLTKEQTASITGEKKSVNLPENMEDNGDGTVTVMYPTVTVTRPLEEVLAELNGKSTENTPEVQNPNPSEAQPTERAAPKEVVGERAEMAERIAETEAALRDQAKKELGTVASAIEEAIKTGEAKEVEVSADSFALYAKDLKDRIEKTKTDFGVPAKQTAKLESELAAHEKKERAFSQTSEALKMVNELLEKGGLDPKEKASLEKRKAILEKITPKIESKRQDQDRGLLERFGDGFKKNITERWRNLHWKKKIAVGVGLGLAGSFAGVGTGAAAAVLAAAYSLRSLGAYNMYQGIKAKRVKSMAEELRKLESEHEGEVDDEYKKLYIEKAVTENTLNKKTAILAGLISFGLPEALKHSGIADAAFEKIGEGAHKIAESLGLTESALAAKSEAAGAAVGAKAEAAASAAASAQHVEGMFDHASVRVQPGDNMYKILEREFHISEHLTENGRQYNAIENILAQIKANPAEYGIVSGNVNELHPGDTIDIAKIAEILKSAKVGGEGIFDHARHLPAAVVKSIEDYMPGQAKEALVSAVSSAKASAVENATVASGITLDADMPHTPDAGANEVGALDADMPQGPASPNVGSPEGVFIPNGGAGAPQGEFVPGAGANVPQGEFIPLSYEYPPMSAEDSRLVMASLNQNILNNGVTMASFVKVGTQDVSSFLANARPGDSIGQMLRTLQSQSGMPLRGNVLQYAQNASLAVAKQTTLGGNSTIA